MTTNIPRPRKPFGPFAKVSLVVVGYIAALLVAYAGIEVYVAATASPDRDTYGAMYAFGDSLLFLGMAGVAAVPATIAALVFLRPVRGFWVVLSIMGLAFAATGLAAGIDYLFARATLPGPENMHWWTGLSVLRILVAPLFAGAFFLSGVIAPNRRAQWALLSATGIETLSFACFALSWFFHTLRH